MVGLGAGALALGGCSLLPGPPRRGLPSPGTAEKTGRVREYTLRAAPLEFEVGSRKVRTWGYEGGVPGPEIRVREGDTLRAKVENRLPEETTIHWHGLPVVNKVDGVPGVTQPPIKAGEDFVYEFVVPMAGSHMYHSHVGLQLDRGLYGPLIVEPRNEDLSYDREHVVVLDDWLDGVGGTPDDALAELRGSSRGPGGMMGGMGGGMMGGAVLEYPLYLINGRPAEDPPTFEVRRGETVRFRVLNPSAETLYRFAVGGHRMSVTHADGLPVDPVETEALRIGMGERYDVLVRADNPGVWQVAAAPENKPGLARAVLRYRESGEEPPPPQDARPRELEGRFPSYADLKTKGLKSFPSSTGPFSGPDRVHRLVLSGGHGGYRWAIDGQLYPDADPLKVSEGEWVRVEMQNQSMMPHPMHLHGHSFQVVTEGGRGPWKDTALVEPHMGNLTFDFTADNPGEWFFHCHNAYHMESGMARVISYR